jgi:hypothetical protein
MGKDKGQVYRLIVGLEVKVPVGVGIIFYFM